MFASLDILAIIVTALLAVAIGSVWYSPLVFGLQWMRVTGISEADMQEAEKHIGRSITLAIVVNIVLFYVVAQFVSFGRELELSVIEVATPLIVAIGAVMAGAVIWEQKSSTYFFINMSYIALVIVGGMSVIWYWPW